MLERVGPLHTIRDQWAIFFGQCFDALISHDIDQSPNRDTVSVESSYLSQSSTHPERCQTDGVVTKKQKVMSSSGGDIASRISPLCCSIHPQFLSLYTYDDVSFV